MDAFNICVIEAMGYDPEEMDDMVMKRIQPLVEGCKTYLLNGGMNKAYIDTCDDQAVSTVQIGVNDMLNGKPGEAKYSPLFCMLATQLCSRKEMINRGD